MHHVSGNSEMTVMEIMKTNPVTVTKNKHTLECVSLMNSKGIDSLIVTDQNGIYEGVLTAEAIIKCGKAGDTVERLINTGVHTVLYSDSAKDAMDTLLSTKSGYLVVVDNSNKVVGIVTRTGMVKSMARALWGGDAK